MKKFFLLLTITANLFLITTIAGCPCDFSSDDSRPFFEQYENETPPTPNDEKEKK